MSLLSVVPDLVAAASRNLQHIGADLRSATSVAATQTTAIAAPAADEVSSAITAVFVSSAQNFQTLSAQAVNFHDAFVNLLNGSAAQYVSTEVANAQQTLAGPAEPVFGRSISVGPLSFLLSFGPEGVYQSVTLYSPFGRAAELLLTGTPFQEFGFDGLTTNLSGTIYTSLGPVEWLSGSVTTTSFPSGGGQFWGSLSGLTPLGYQAVELTGFYPLQVTGGSVTSLGVQVSYSGGQFGIVPLFLRALGY